jgi:hypothetical protein
VPRLWVHKASRATGTTSVIVEAVVRWSPAFTAYCLYCLHFVKVNHFVFCSLLSNVRFIVWRNLLKLCIFSKSKFLSLFGNQSR